MSDSPWSTKGLAALALGVALGAAGCAGDLRKEREGGGGGGGERIVSMDLGDGSTQTRIDASRSDNWIFLDMETRAEVFPAFPGTSPDWDLGFQRFKIKTNSGISGGGGMEVAPLEGQDFDALAQAPAGGYLVDKDDSADIDTDPDTAFLAPPCWYSYNLAEHTVRAKPIVYVVKTVEGSFFKVQMLGYYDDHGTGGYPTFRWAPVSAP